MSHRTTLLRAAEEGAIEALAWLPVTLYAAYGSNLDPARMGERCPHSPLQTTGWLTGWRLTFGGEDLGWDGSLSTIVEDPIDQVFVAVYDVTREDEASLDDWESAGTGLYRKAKVRVSTMTGELLVWTYVLDAYEGGLPSASYLGVLADAAEAADAPDDYVESPAPPALPEHGLCRSRPSRPRRAIPAAAVGAEELQRRVAELVQAEPQPDPTLGVPERQRDRPVRFLGQPEPLGRRPRRDRTPTWPSCSSPAGTTASPVWQHASTLLPSVSRTNPPKYRSWYSGHSRGSCSTSAPSSTAAATNARTASASAAWKARCISRFGPTPSKVEIQKSGLSVPYPTAVSKSITRR